MVHFRNCLAGTELLQSPFRMEFSMGSLLRWYRQSIRRHRQSLRCCCNPWGDQRSPMPIVALLTKHHKTLLNIVEHHETLVKHCDTSWNVVKNHEPLVKHREPLVKHHETLKTFWNTLKTLWNITKPSNTRHLMPWYQRSMQRHWLCRRSHGVSSDNCAEFPVILAIAELV